MKRKNTDQTTRQPAHLSQQDYIPQVSVDCVIFGFRKKELKILLPKLDFKGDFWALPSGFVFQHESIDDAARRIVENRTGIKDIYLEQFRVFGGANRNSRAFLEALLAQNREALSPSRFSQKEYDWFTKRFISLAYYALVDLGKVLPEKSALDQSIDWYPLAELPPLIMDHRQIVLEAHAYLRNNLDEKLNAFNLLPPQFTMKEVQQLYEAIFETPFARNNFQKRILNKNVLERLDKKFTGAANRAPYLYQFKNRTTEP